MEMSCALRGESALCVWGPFCSQCWAYLTQLYHQCWTQPQLLGPQGSWTRVFAFCVSLWMRNTEHSYCRFIVTFPTVTAGF